ncbi:hypothetical protein B0F90DRAFT_1810294 [Multifurca ochricompacta]|uniref:Fe2OG dioxygenase domain-containing protein n=1 Tax=Multifurca ochricompacta TaxID=376703 RepID=A0AAD4QNG1_9AGAM|nr:hypothetical protein B0F90DRAFT_1810294 [Multifurca ochricompacta]
MMMVIGHHIDLANATFYELEQLSQACEPATFRRNSKEYVIVRDYLLEGKDSKRDIKVWLYKLKLNGHYPDKGSFFKPHFRSENAFGSLVIVFPTAHEGGALHLRDDGQEWMFDSAIGYIAFFSDIEHEVAPVISGHRVTLTYNLYFDDDSKPTDSTLQDSYPPLATNERAFRETLEGLLENPEFLADGGTLGFSLRNIYPVLNARFIDYVYDLLKRSDAVIYETFKSLVFEPKLYLGSTEASIIDWVFDCAGEWEEKVDITKILRSRSGMVVWHKEHDASDLKWKNPEKVHWVSPVTRFNKRECTFPTYNGYRLKLDYVYGDMCLVIRIGKGGEKLPGVQGKVTN